MTSKSRKIVPPFHCHGNCIPSAAIRRPDFGDWPSSGRPFVLIFRHSDATLLSFLPRRRCPRPKPSERVLVADHRSRPGCWQTDFSGLRPRRRKLRSYPDTSRLTTAPAGRYAPTSLGNRQIRRTRLDTSSKPRDAPNRNSSKRSHTAWVRTGHSTGMLPKAASER